MRQINYPVYDKCDLEVTSADQVRHNSRLLLLAILILMVIMGWSYWPVIKDLFNAWQNNDDSVYQLVPIIALFFIWRERKAIVRIPLVPCWWVGISLIILAQIARTYGMLISRTPTARYSMVLMISGLVVLVAGWNMFRKLLWILLFLFLMVPIPSQFRDYFSLPLQNLATTSTVFILEAFGVEVIQKGNIVTLNETTTMGVAEACGGLRMITAFVIVTAFITYLAKCSRPRKVFLMLSSIPIALVCNIVRLCLTAGIMILVSVEVGNKFFHDFAGLAMMPVAVLLLFAEMWMMDRIIGVSFKPATQHCKTNEYSHFAARAVVKQKKPRK
jgi:exosortase